MKKRIFVALMVFSIVILSGCTVFSFKTDRRNVEEAVKTAVSDEYITGEIEGLLSDGTFQSFCCYKVGNTVVASARYYDLPEVATGNTACFQLPEGFCPRTNTRCNGIIMVDGSSVPVILSINTEGVISVGYSNVKTMTQVAFSATFPS